MYCHKCGSKIDEGNKFCPSCGSEVESIDGPKENNRTDKGRLLDSNTSYDDRSTINSDPSIINYKNPKTGEIVKVNKLSVRAGAFLITPIFFLIIGETQHALISFGINFLLGLTGAGYPLVWGVAGYYAYESLSIVDKKWKSKGYIRV